MRVEIKAAAIANSGWTIAFFAVMITASGMKMAKPKQNMVRQKTNCTFSMTLIFFKMNCFHYSIGGDIY